MPSIPPTTNSPSSFCPLSFFVESAKGYAIYVQGSFVLKLFVAHTLFVVYIRLLVFFFFFTSLSAVVSLLSDCYSSASSHESFPSCRDVVVWTSRRNSEALMLWTRSLMHWMRFLNMVVKIFASLWKRVGCFQCAWWPSLFQSKTLATKQPPFTVFSVGGENLTSVFTTALASKSIRAQATRCRLCVNNKVIISHYSATYNGTWLEKDTDNAQAISKWERTYRLFRTPRP